MIPEEPYDRVPSHLREPLQHWLDGAFGCRLGQVNPGNVRTETMLAVAATCRIRLTAGARDAQLYHEIVKFCQDPEEFLDVLHATIQLLRGSQVSRPASRIT